MGMFVASQGLICFGAPFSFHNKKKKKNTDYNEYFRIRADDLN